MFLCNMKSSTSNLLQIEEIKRLLKEWPFIAAIISENNLFFKHSRH